MEHWSCGLVIRLMWFLEDGVPGRARMLIQNLRHPAYRGPPNEMMNGINGVIEGI
jgi:hypothetical protein